MISPPCPSALEHVYIKNLPAYKESYCSTVLHQRFYSTFFSGAGRQKHKVCVSRIAIVVPSFEWPNSIRNLVPFTSRGQGMSKNFRSTGNCEFGPPNRPVKPNPAPPNPKPPKRNVCQEKQHYEIQLSSFRLMSCFESSLATHVKASWCI
jgi:hypothetical protein